MADHYGVKVKLQLTDSKTDLRLQLQTLLNEAVAGNPLQLNKFKVGKGNFREAINQSIKEFNTSGKHNQIQLDNVSFKATTEAVKKLQDELKAKELELKIGKINADSAVSNLRNQLVKMLSGLQIGGVKEFLDGAEITAPAKDLDNFVANLERLKVMQSELRASGKAVLGLGTSDAVAELRQEYNALTDEITRAIQASGDWEGIDGLQQRVALLHQNVAAQKELNKEAEKAAKAAAEPVQITMASDKQRLALISQINSWLTKNTRATDESKNAMRKFMAELTLGNMAADRLGEITNEVQKIKIETIQAGKTGKSFIDTYAEGLRKFGSWATVTKSLTTAMQAARRMVDVVITLDTAMTELKRVTDLTSSSYDAFQLKAGETAKRIGATISDTVYATADFARLGFDINESAELAEAALVYKNIGDGIDDISIATESLISTIKAFGYEAADAMYVVDMFNEVGNNFAISSKGVGDALQRSAAALAAGGNTLQESIGLITAANEIIQDPDSVGKDYAQRYSNVFAS